jgi:hypothetical protein
LGQGPGLIGEQKDKKVMRMITDFLPKVSETDNGTGNTLRKIFSCVFRTLVKELKR